MGYNPIEDFQRKDLLESGDPEKIVRGTELQVEFEAISADLSVVRNEQGNLNYLPLTGGTVNGDISAKKITATEFIGGTLSATNVSGTTFAGNGAALTGMKMSQLTDVKMTSVQRDDILIWNGSAWEASDVYDIVSPLTYAGVIDVTQPAPSANNGDTFVNDKEGYADSSFKGLAGVLILEGKFVIYDAPTDQWNSPGNSADAGVNYVKAGSGIEVDSVKPSEPVVSIDRSETDAWYLAADAETSKWETVTGGIAYSDGNVGIGTASSTKPLSVWNSSKVALELEPLDSTSRLLSYDRAAQIYHPLRIDTGSFEVTASSDGNTSASRMTIDSSGNVGIGVTPKSSYASQTNVEIGEYLITAGSGDCYAGANLYIDSSGNWKRKVVGGSTLLTQDSANSRFIFYSAGSDPADTSISWTQQLTLDNSGNLTAAGNVTAYSDERLKSDVETLDGSKVYDMRGVSFTKDGEAGSGVIAQELQKVAPELVHEGEEYLSVAYGNLVGYLIEAVKDLKAEVEELKRAR